ncbi:MAG: response regulator [Bacteroidota bacterium]|jgi:two-component system chemotaxis response regulator CheY
MTKKVLIVDDSAYNRTLLAAILKKKNLQTEIAENGEEAIAKFKELKPDIVFLDNMMPKISGIDALREMKKINPDCIGIMLTALSSMEDVQLAKEAGANGYLLKPFEIEKIYGVLKKFNIIE